MPRVRSMWASLAALLIIGASPAAAKTTTIGQLAPSPASTAVGCPAGETWDVLDPSVPSGRKYVVPAGDGVISSWSTRANSSSGQALELKVYRRVSGTTYEVVGHDGPRSLTANKVNTFRTNIPVQPGDVIGLASLAPPVQTACAFNATGADLEVGQDVTEYASETFTAYSPYRDNVTAVVGPEHTKIHNGVYWSWVTSTNTTFTGSGLGLGNLNGTGGGTLNTGGHTTGEAVDAATGKIFWADYPNVFTTSCTSGSGGNQIRVSNLNGTGSARFNTHGATVDGPNGIAIDPAHGRVYWANELANKISYARLNGTGGADLNTGTATVNCPFGITVDPALGRVYWASAYGNTISYANLNGSGGGDLNTSGATINGPAGVAIDPAIGRIYWANALGTPSISWAALNGTGGGNLPPGAGTLNFPYGVAIDPTAGRIYWANNGSVSTANAIAYENLNGSGGGNVAMPGAPVSQAKLPVLFKAPHGAGAPHVSGASTSGSTLACSRGTWAADVVPALLYQAPQTFSYRWTRNGAPIAGATKPRLVTKSGGSYACTVTARNYSGAAVQKSAPHVMH